MSLFLYETHLHTSEASACANVSGREQARIYKKAGYAGIIVTDHFFNGNTAVPHNLPWEKRVDLFCKGYENAKKEGEKIGLSVFFGFEFNYRTTEFLVYGLDSEWIKSHPDMTSWSVEELYYNVHKDGGYMVHAHPFRDRFYVEKIRLFPENVDAIEGYNVGNASQSCDNRAVEYAKSINVPILAGTDAHWHEPKRNAVAFERPLESIHDFIDCVKAGKYSLVLDMKLER